ncbi:MAG TPA: peptide deformylase [Steroidobacteraceae bacterium]|nr:peptide deformylase [Steroidobacteraceae bacterium]
MAKLTILEYPDPRLRTKAEPVAVVDDAIRRLVDDMFETMYASKGIGLAATQVDVHQRVLVTDVSSDRTEPRVFINAQIIEREGSTEAEEGCLSVPGIYDTLRARSEKVRVRALDRDGQPFELEADGLLAVCLQHELDHLDGKLFVDYLSELKRNRIRKKLEKERKERAAVPVPVRTSSV